MFPEATRSKRGEQKLYKTGAARLALETMPLSYRLLLPPGDAGPQSRGLSFPVGQIFDWARDSARAGEDAIALMGRVEKWIEDEMRVIDPDAYGQGVSNAA